MGQREYIYRFKWHAKHSILVQNKRGPIHAHTFEIAIYIRDKFQKLVQYDEVEKYVKDFLLPYEDQYLNELPAFQMLDPTLEHIAEYFYTQLKTLLAQNNIEVTRLDMSEIPTRIYIVKEPSPEEEAKVMCAMMQAIRSATVDQIMERTKHLIKDQTAPGQEGKEKKETAKQQEGKEREELDKQQGEQEEAEQQEGQKEAEAENQQVEQEQQKSQEPQAVVAVVEKEQPQEVLVPEVKAGPGEHQDIPRGIENKESKVAGWKIMASIMLLVTLAIGLFIYVSQMEGSPWGADIYGHLFKANMLYENIKEGNYYPLLTPLWYNGVQPFRYWAPLPYYLLAGLQWLAQGSIETAYLYLISFSFLVGGMGWLLFGIKEKRVLLGLVLGSLWFFLPDNARVFFSEGNIPRIVIAMILPYFFFFFWQFVEHRKRWAMLGVIAMTSLIILSHLMIAAMLGVSCFVFLIFYTAHTKRWIPSFQVLLGMLLAFALCGLWVYPALQGGIMSIDQEAMLEVMESLTQRLAVSLNPVLRLSVDNYIGKFYFGLSIFVICLLGGVFSNAKSRAGFITTILFLLGTTSSLVPLLRVLPMNQLWWMVRYVPIVYCLFIVALMSWKKCKQYVLVSMMVLLGVDSYYSFNLPLYTDDVPTKNTYTLDIAKSITKQRIALIDNSLFGSHPSFYIPTGKDAKAYSYGWAWQGAETASNIVLLNTAMDRGNYTYLFDRTLELGCDTVLLRKASIEKIKKTFEDVDTAAKLSGYSLYDETNTTYIYHQETPEQFGVVTKYEGICIGRAAKDLSLAYPAFEVGHSYRIDDYTLAALEEYKVIYLSDFQYTNKQLAEQMLRTLARKGVQILIDMNRIPVDVTTNRKTFLGVTAQNITFNTRLPDLFFEKEKYTAKPFKEGYESWNTVYLEDLKHPQGFAWFNGNKLIFWGEHEEENITFIGFNLIFHAMEDEDENVLKLIEQRIHMSPVPSRKLVPISLEVDHNTVTVNVPEDQVNTTFAYMDTFESERQVSSKHHLLEVNKGLTRLRVTYPYFIKGVIVTLMGLLGEIALFIWMYQKKEEGR